jgi:tetratricopeptide (TPR) repeat protein
MAVQREQVVQTAEKYVSKGRIEPAIREYRKLLAENPNDINTLNRVGDLYAKIHRIDEAIEFFSQIAEQYTTEGFFVKAIAIYKKIIKLDPTRLEVYESLAELYHKQGLVNEARTQYQVLADYYQKHDNAASAIAIYLKMVDLEPENPTYHVKLAEIYQQQQLIEKAMWEYRVIAELMIAAGRPQEAAQVYERALDLESRNINFISDAVHKLKAAGHVAGAARILALAMERNPQAERVAQMAGMAENAEKEEEPESARAPEPEVSAGAPGLSMEDFAPPPGLFDSVPLPAPELEAEPDRNELSFSGLLDEADLSGDLSGAMREAAAAVGPAAKGGAAPAEEEFELDLDEVFVLDLEGEEEPSSLVKPPADMLGPEPRRPAWAQDATPPPVQAVPVEEEIVVNLEEETVLDLEEEVATTSSAVSSASLFMAELAEIELPALEVEDFEPAAPVTAEPAAPAAPAPEPPAPSPEPPLEIDHDLLERTAAEIQPQNLDRDAEDLVSEAEVLAKYGLEEKALERLRDALRIVPKHLGAYTLMIQLHLDKGRHPRVAELANQMSSIAAGGSDREVWLKVRKRLADAGFRLDGDRVADVPRVDPGDDTVSRMLKGLVGGKPARKAPSRPAEAPAAPAPPVVPPVAPAAMAPPPPAAPPPSPPVAAAPPSRPGVFNPLEIGEMVEAEDDDWTLHAPAARDAGSLKLGSSAAAPPPSQPAPWSTTAPGASPDPATVARSNGSGGGLDDSLSWLDETNGHSRRQESVHGLFDEDDDFFDLAGELEQELSQEGNLFQGDLLMPTEQSLEEIVEGFKKGVAEHLSPTDYDTHFNLGIAYREMGLIDEAIGEFQLASKDARYLVSCCSMLGLCFLDKGLPELAIKWYRRGLDAANLSEEDSLGLLYDLANAYSSIGDNPAAYRTLVELYGINSNYRDVVARIEELGRAR